MNRRKMIKTSFFVFILGGLLFFNGCGKQEKPLVFGNQEKLWNLITSEQSIEEPTELAYTKDTPAFYRDQSMGKADPSFVAKIGGG
jgi:hypothetical protein